VTLSQKNPGGTTRSGTDARKGTPNPASERGGFLRMLRPASIGGNTGLSSRFTGLMDWVRSIIAELRKVTWPSREVTRNLTIIVIAVSTAVGAFLGAIDYLFKLLFEQLLRP